MTVEEYVRPDGRPLHPAEAALFRGAVDAYRKRKDCARRAMAGESYYMALQASYLTSIQSCPGLWEIWEDFNSKN